MNGKRAGQAGQERRGGEGRGAEGRGEERKGVKTVWNKVKNENNVKMRESNRNKWSYANGNPAKECLVQR